MPEEVNCTVHLSTNNKVKWTLTQHLRKQIPLSNYSAWTAEQSSYRDPERHEQHHLSCGILSGPLKPVLPASPVRLFMASLICETSLSYYSDINTWGSGTQMGTTTRKGACACQRVVTGWWVFDEGCVFPFLSVFVCFHSGAVIFMYAVVFHFQAFSPGLWVFSHLEKGMC